MHLLALVFLAALPDESWVNPPDREWPGVTHATFESASMKRKVGYSIYLPPDYVAGGRRYPVTYYLHGMTDCESTHLELTQVLHEGIKAGKIEPMILVYTMGGRTSWFCDSADGTVMGESVIIKDLIPHIDATYRTIASRGGRAVQGWSMGGFGALKFGFKRPDLFSSVVTYGGGFRDADSMKNRRSEALKKTFGDLDGFRRNAPWHWAKANEGKIRGKLPLHLFVGTKDFLYEANQEMRAFLKRMDFPHEYAEIDGVGHNPKKVFAEVGLRALRFSRRHFSAK